jgi:hypothetical protein
MNPSVAENEGLAVVRDAQLRVETAVSRVELDGVQEMLDRGRRVIDGDDDEIGPCERSAESGSA